MKLPGTRLLIITDLINYIIRAHLGTDRYKRMEGKLREARGGWSITVMKGVKKNRKGLKNNNNNK